MSPGVSEEDKVQHQSKDLHYTLICAEHELMEQLIQRNKIDLNENVHSRTFPSINKIVKTALEHIINIHVAHAWEIKKKKTFYV